MLDQQSAPLRGNWAVAFKSYLRTNRFALFAARSYPSAGCHLSTDLRLPKELVILDRRMRICKRPCELNCSRAGGFWGTAILAVGPAGILPADRNVYNAQARCLVSPQARSLCPGGIVSERLRRSSRSDNPLL